MPPTKRPVQATSRRPPVENCRYGRLPGGPRSKTAGTGEVPGGLRAKRLVRARSTTGPKTTADTFTVFSGSKKSGRYVCGFQRAPKKRPIRLRFSARPKKAADTFTVFGGAKKNGRHVYGFWHKSHPYLKLPNVISGPLYGYPRHFIQGIMTEKFIVILASGEHCCSLQRMHIAPKAKSPSVYGEL